MTTTEQRLLDHALAIGWHALPASAQAATRAFLFDSLAVGIAGHRAPFADAIGAAARSWSMDAAGESFVLGARGLRLPAPAAAFVNAYQIHSQEYDCVHEAAVAHPMATVCAALLAEAGREPCHGEDFLAALVAGVDVIATLGVAVRGKLRFFRPATAGIFGCVAALSRLRRLDRETAADALGYALAFAGGTMQAHVEGKPALAVQVAAAARSAIEAVDLARCGLPGPRQAIDGAFGYFALFEDDVDIAPELDRLGTVWRIEQVSWKPFPTGRAAHGALVALREMSTRHGVDPDTLDRFEYRAPPLIHRLVGRRPQPGMSIAYARLCFAWLGALMLQRGEVGLGDFVPATLADPKLLALAERFAIVIDDNPDQAAFAPATARAFLRDGRCVEVEVERQFGAPEWPLSLAQQMEKAAACLAFGGLGGGQAQALFDAVATLAGADDVAEALASVAM